MNGWKLWGKSLAGIGLAVAIVMAPLACSVRTKQDRQHEARAESLNLIEEAENYSNQGLYQQAIQRYLKALDTAPSPKIYYGLGHCYASLQEYDTAVLYLQKAVDAAPDNKLFFFELTHAEEMMNSTGQALALGAADGPGPRDYVPPPQTDSAARLMGAKDDSTAKKSDKTSKAGDSSKPANSPARPMSLASSDDFRPRPLLPPSPGAQVQAVRTAPRGAGPPPAKAAALGEPPALTPAETPHPPGPEELEIATPPAAAPELLPHENAARPAGRPPLPSAFEPAAPEVPAGAAPVPPAGVLPSEAPSSLSQERPAEKGPGLLHAYKVLFGENEKEEEAAAPPIRPGEAAGTTYLGEAGFHVEKADDFLKRGEDQKAVEEYIEALKYDERNPAIRTKLGEAYLQMGDDQRGREQIDRALEIDPNYFGAVYRKAEMQYDAGHPEEALELAERAVRIDEQSADANLLLGDVYAKLDRQSRAESLYQRAHELQPESPKPDWKLGNLSIQVKDYARAREYYDQALKLDPKFVPVYNNLGYLAQMEGKYDESLQRFQKAVDLDPKWVKAYKNMGILYESHLNKPKEAVKCYEKYIRLGGPDSDEVRSWIAQIKARGS